MSWWRWLRLWRGGRGGEVEMGLGRGGGRREKKEREGKERRKREEKREKKYICVDIDRGGKRWTRMSTREGSC